jgi:hypothetical protein
LIRVFQGVPLIAYAASKETFVADAAGADASRSATNCQRLIRGRHTPTADLAPLLDAENLPIETITIPSRPETASLRPAEQVDSQQRRHSKPYITNPKASPETAFISV